MDFEACGSGCKEVQKFHLRTAYGTFSSHWRNEGVPWAERERSMSMRKFGTFEVFTRDSLISIRGGGNQKTTLNRIISAIDGYQHDMLYFYRTPIIHNQNMTRG